MKTPSEQLTRRFVQLSAVDLAEGTVFRTLCADLVCLGAQVICQRRNTAAMLLQEAGEIGPLG